jgi:peptidoglycan/xylan/chitin deacetylase (PgdA/CDA1 family)
MEGGHGPADQEARRRRQTSLALTEVGRQGSAPNEPAPVRPELSAVVVTHNRRELLRNCLRSLGCQTAPVEEYEVVVAVDGSTDGTVEMLADLETPFRLSVVTQPQGGPSAARNAGAARATGRVLLFVDDDEEAAPGLVASHLEAHRTRARIAGVGVIERHVPVDADRLARLRAEEGNVHAEHLTTRPVTYLDCYGGNCSVSRATFDEVGGFAVDLIRENDYELAYRLHQARVDFVFLPDAVVTEHRTRPWRGILDDVEGRGRLAVELHSRHPPMITTMGLGGFGGATRASTALRRLFLSLHALPRDLARLCFLLPKRWARPWLRLVLDYSYWRGVRSAAGPDLWRRSRRGTVILRYHAFGTDGEQASRYVVPRRRFERQLAWLERRRYHILGLSQYLDCRQACRFPPAKSVVITIDDGYVDNDTVARPVLERLGVPATVFLITGTDGRDRDKTDPALAGRPLIDLARARSMLGGAIEFGAHTRTHPDLTVLGPGAAEGEVTGSRHDLEAIGASATAFAYPYGEVSSDVRQIVRQAGFLGACGVKPGHNRPATDSFDLRRIEVRGTDSLLRFAVSRPRRHALSRPSPSRAPAMTPATAPEITVVIPSHNRRELLLTLLESLARQTLPPDGFEVVVALDGSSDGTEEMLEELSMPYRLTTLPLTQGGVGRARNRGAERASGRFLLFLDDDMIADPMLLAEHLGAQQRGHDIVGLGPMLLLPHAKPSRWARWRQERRMRYFERFVNGRPLSFIDCWGGNLCLPRELFLAVGGFKEGYRPRSVRLDFLMEDAELGFRLSEHGARFVFVEGAIAAEDDRETLRFSLRDAERRGAGELLLYELHPAMLPTLQFGGRGDLNWRLVGYRRLLLTLRVPPLVVAALAAVVPGEQRSLDMYTLLYTYCHWRGVRRAVPDRETWRRMRRGTSILMYHAIAGPGEAEERYTISERRFRRQMGWLKRRGYTVIALDELVRYRREFRLPPEKSVVITFDDGYADTLELALPVLERLGFPCSLFLLTAAGTGGVGNGEDELGRRKRLRLDQASAFLARGSVGAHTRTHVDLLTVDLEEARAEIAASKAELEAALGVPVTLFAYPYGSYDEEIVRLVREVGFEAACTATPGPNWPATDSYKLLRFEVYGTDSLFRFALTVWLGDIKRVLPRRS